MKKIRLDQLVARQVDSLDRARRLIQAGLVLVNDQKLDKPGVGVDAEARVRLLEAGHGYASRGGLKLEGALDDLRIDARGRLAADLGASTGGFTDCLLKRGALRVHAVDVGYGLLDWRLRQDERVHLLERTNVRHLTPERLGELVDLVVADLSFLSLALVLPVVRDILRPGGEAALMVKPQFELASSQVGPGGIVEDDHLRQAAADSVLRAAEALGLRPLGQAESRVPGQKGNREIFIHLRKPIEP